MFCCVGIVDEEVGGHKGMRPFVKSEEFKKLNVGFGLDEGVANPEESFHLFYGERAIWRKNRRILYRVYCLYLKMPYALNL